MATALALPLLLTLCAYAVGVTFLLGTEVKLNAVVEAAAGAAADVYGATGHAGLARDAARRVAESNTIQGASLTIGDKDIELGRYQSDGASWSFDPGATPANAVRVTGRIAGGNAFGPARLLHFLDAQEVSVVRTAIAVEVERDIALATDRGYSMAYAEGDLLPPLLPGLLQIVPAPPSAPLGWLWCMTAPLNSRWRNTTLAVDTFLASLLNTAPDEQVALVSFADEAVLEAPLTLNYPLITRLLQLLSGAFCGGGSNKEQGIRKGAEALTDAATARPGAQKILIVLSDSPAEEGDPVAAARAAAQQGIIVHTISYGRDADVVLMQQIATAGGGRHWRAEDLVALQQALGEIAASIPQAMVNDSL